VTGGVADIRNNTESVFLPAGVTGAFSVKVVATNIAGDGVPGVGALDGVAGEAARQGGHLVAAGEPGLDERAADVVGASEHEKSHAQILARRPRPAKHPSLST
jgi:hypothetical protein